MQNLLDFVQKDGKGLMGIHAATDAYYKDAPEYGELIGGSFTGHPWHHVAYQINDPQSPLTAMFKARTSSSMTRPIDSREYQGPQGPALFSRARA